MKNKFSLGVSLCAGLAVIGGALTPAAYAQESPGNATATCQNPGVEIVDGKINWGIKHSYRNYIYSNIARGSWTTAGAVTEDSTDAAGRRKPDFQFHFDVDPNTSTVKLDAQGNVVESDIQTQDSTLIFEGHHGALYSQMKSPYVKTEGNVVKPGTGYVGYYVEGKPMTQYKESDRTDENKRTGKGEFGVGKTEGWKLEGNKLTMSGTNPFYTPQPGSDRWKDIHEGIDVLFMGAYGSEDPLDDLQVELNVKNTCLDEETDTTTPGGTTEDSTPGQTNEQGAQQENTKPQGEATPPAAPKKPEIKQPENKQPEKKPEAEKQPPAAKQPGDKTNPGKTNPSKEEGTPKAPGSSLGKDFSSNAAESKGLNKFQQAFNVALGLVTFAGMATMIGNLFHKAFGPQVQHFLNKLPFKF